MNFEFDASLKVPPMLTLLWFSRDLRLTDNPALAAAIARGGPIVPVFVLDDPDCPPSAPMRQIEGSR